MLNLLCQFASILYKAIGLFKCIVLWGNGALVIEYINATAFYCSCNIEMEDGELKSSVIIQPFLKKFFFVCGNPQFIGKLAETDLFCQGKCIHLMCVPLWYCWQYHAQYCSEIAKFTNTEYNLLGLNAQDFSLFFKFHNVFLSSLSPSSLLSFFCIIIIQILPLKREKKKVLRLNTVSLLLSLEYHQ